MATRKFEKLLKKARGLRDKGKLERSLRHYRSACAEADSGPEVWAERAEIAAQLGEMKEAVGALYWAADVCEKRGERDDAARFATRVIDLDPDHEGARGIARRSGGDTGERAGEELGDAESRAGAADATDEAPVGTSTEARDESLAEPHAPVDATPGSGPEPEVATASPGEAAQAPGDDEPGDGPNDGPADDEPDDGPADDEPDDGPADDEPGDGPADDEPADASGQASAAGGAPGEGEADAESEDRRPPREPAASPATSGERGEGASEQGAVREAEVRADNGAASPPPDAASAEVAGPERDDDSEGRSDADAAAGASGALALVDVELAAAEEGEPGELPLDVPEPGGRSLRATTAAVEGTSGLCELDSDLVARFIDAGELVYRPARTAVFNQGEVGESLYLVLQGTLVVQRREGGDLRRIATLRPGALFGEMAVLAETPRWATVRAERDSTLIEVSRRTVRELIRADERVLVLLLRFYRARLVGNLMASSPVFRELEDREREELLSKFRLREYAEGRLVVGPDAPSEERPAAGLYVVLAGELASRRTQTGEELGGLGPGDVFGGAGDDALVRVEAKSRAWILELPRSSLRALADTRPELAAHLESVLARGAGGARQDADVALTAMRPV